jgi:c-di-GMP-binding flagellar brake protein YcgR
MAIPVDLNKEGRQHLRSDRENFRVKVHIPCEVGPPGGEMNVALMLDLSRGGAKFSGNQLVINSMFPENEAPLGVVLDVFINMHFNLSEDESPDSLIKTGARVIHTERLAQDLFQVGVEFIDLTEAAKKSLQDFISGCPEE